MSCKVTVTEYAYAELIDIHFYIAKTDSVAKADHVVERIEETIVSLSQSPNRGNHPPELLDLGNKEFREIFFKPYRIIYQVKGNEVQVLVISDGRRDMKALLLERLIRTRVS